MSTRFRPRTKQCWEVFTIERAYPKHNQAAIHKWEMTDEDFRRAFHENKSSVYNFALRLTGSISTAEDLCQECFLELLQRPSHYDPRRGSLRAFLLGMTRNLAH